MKFFTIVIFSFFLSTAPAIAVDKKRILTAEQWAVPRSAEALIAMPAIRQTINEMQAFPDNRLLIKHPGGDEGSLWVSELRSWLVSLGVSSQTIELVPGSEQNHIELSVIRAAMNTSNAVSDSSGR